MIKKFLTLSTAIIIFFCAAGTVSADNLESDAVAVKLLNELRAEHGLNALSWNPQSYLQRAAAVRAEEIVKKFSHTRPNGSTCFTVLKEFGLRYRLCGENIAMGTYLSPEYATEMWTNSPGHYKNMVNPDFKEIGLACFELDDTVYWVQLFYTPQ